MAAPTDAQAAYREAVAPIATSLPAKRARHEKAETLDDRGGAEGSPSATIEPYREVIAAIPANADVYYLVARAIRDAGDPNAAVEIFKLGLKIKPDHTASLYELGTLLAALQFCRLSRTYRCRRADLDGPDAAKTLMPNSLTYPLLLRVPGSHGGDAFDKIDHIEAIGDFMTATRQPIITRRNSSTIARRTSSTEKYRFMAVAGEPYPYHLAIGTTWKVHHYSTDTAYHPWMQHEEASFLDDPWMVFSSAHQGALRRICMVLDLDFFGVDCAVDADGNVVVFEANTSMLVHDDNAGFEYKTPHCARIRMAFQAMVARARHKAAGAGT